MQISSELLDRACTTEGAAYDTGLRVREFEVWAIPPNRYRHYTEFFLRHPQPLEWSVRPYEFLGKTEWMIGYELPDGKWRSAWSSQKTEGEAIANIPKYTKGEKPYASCRVNVFYTRNGSFCGKEEGIPAGKVLWEPCLWDAFNFEITQEECALLLEFAEIVDSEWRRRAAAWREAESERTKAIAQAVALESLSPAVVHATFGPTECLECGAVFDEPGHVESGGMGCDRCNA